MTAVLIAGMLLRVGLHAGVRPVAVQMQAITHGHGSLSPAQLPEPGDFGMKS